jgi:hypothetical protein
MEQNFQTSFIPKRPIVEDRAVAKPVSLFLVVSIVIFFSMVVSFGVIYFFKSSLAKNIVAMNEQLDLAKNRFEPAKISQLQSLDKRLRASNKVLANHIAVSPIFKSLSEITLKTIRFTNFSYESGSEQSNTILVKLSGQSVGYRSIALQADLFSKNKNFIDPVFSNLTLDEKGNVLFDLEFSVDRSFVDYKQTLLTEANSTQ